MVTEGLSEHGTGVKVFISYSHKDEKLKNELLEHLALLKRLGVIAQWHDRKIPPGSHFSQEIDIHLESAQIILLLVSAHFLASDYCYEKEMERALQKHKLGQAHVIPIFLRPCDWNGAPFGKLQGLPLDAKPVSKWSNRDQAFEAITKGIRIIAESSRPPEASSSDEGSSKLEIRTIVDPEDDDLLRTLLVLYEHRIPETERFETPDIIRWMREDLERTESLDTAGAWNHFVVAKSGTQVCGFILAHSYLSFGLVFIAYLVAKKGVLFDDLAVSRKLVDFIFESFDHDDKRAAYQGFLLEVDDPLVATTEKDRKICLARIRLFCTLAERRGLHLRVLDFDYRQPSLTIPQEAELGQGLPMLLMFAGRSGSKEERMERREVSRFLDFICNALYPEGFSDIPSENEQYRAYTSALCRVQIANLPEQIRTLSFAQVRARNARTCCSLQQDQLDAWRTNEKAEGQAAD